MRINLDDIGQLFQKPHWSNCYFRVRDVGVYTVWGDIVDPKAGIVSTTFFPLEDEWIQRRDAQTVISLLPLTTGNK